MKATLLRLGISVLLATCGLVADGPKAREMGSIRRAYQCGPLAALEVGRALQPGNDKLEALARVETLAPGLSMLELAHAARLVGVDLVPVRLDPGEGLWLPAVALFHQSHYVAVFAADGDQCRVYDPLVGEAREMSRAAVLKACQGLLLVSSSAISERSHLLSEGEAASHAGGATTIGTLFNDEGEECPNDAFDNTQKCPKCDECQVGTQDDPDGDHCSSCGASTQRSGPSGGGMAVWKVTEPDMNLWIVDTPLFYTTSHDDWMTFRLVYKQRNVHDATNVFGVGKGWECNLRSYGVPDNLISGNIKRHSGGGGQQSFVPNGQVREWTTRAKLGPHGGGFGYELRGPHSGVINMDFGFTNIAAIAHYFPSQRIDSRGRTSKYNYAIVGQSIRLTSFVDADGKTNNVSYQNPTFTNLITKVENPYGYAAFLAYDEYGRLTNITDMANLSTGFAYDDSGLITSMRTPYGTTLFTCTTNEPPTAWSNTGYANVVNRSVRVVEPNNATHLYFYRHSSDHLNPTSQTVLLPDSCTDVPNTATNELYNTFDNSQLSQRNSFYWGPRQYDLINSTFRANPTNWNLLVTNDYRYARIKHWLWQGTEGSVTVSRSLSLMRSPCPDATQDGVRTWFDYEGQLHNNCEGTNSRPRFIAKTLPDGSASFRFIERSNSWEHPTMLIESWSSNASTVLLRTNLIKYENDEMRVRGVYRLRGATQELVLGLGDYLDSLPRRITNAAGEVTVVSYDATNRQVLNISRPSGLITTNRYFASGDYKGWLEWSKDYAIEGGSNIVFGMSSFTYLDGMVRTATDARDHTVTLTWDSLERLTQVASAERTQSFAYCLLDLTNRVDGLGNTQWFGHDNMGRLTWHKDELQRTNYFDYCTCGSLETVTDPTGRTTTFFYDAAGRLTNAVYPGDIAYSLGYDTVGRLTQIKDGNGKETVRFFNNQGLITTVSNAVGIVHKVIPNIDDLPAVITTAEGVISTNTYDVLGRIRTRTWPDSGEEVFTYSVRGLTNWLDPMDKAVRFTVDADGRLQKRERVDAHGVVGETIRFEYNAAGDLTKLWDGASNATQWGYDGLGRPTNKIDAAGVTNFVWKYDAEDRLTNRVDSLSQNTGYGYDAAGNLTSVNYSGSTHDLDLGYDSLNRLTNLVDAVGTTGFSYSNNGRVESEAGPWGDDTLAYVYNNLGLRQRLSVPWGGTAWNVDYAYDAALRLTNILSAAGSFTNQFLTGIGGFSGAGRLLEKVKFPGGSVMTNKFDPVGRLLETTLRNAGATTLDKWTYGYGVDGLMQAATNVFGSRWKYTYDGVEQLKTALSTNSTGSARLHEQFSYSYDAGGNLTNRLKNALSQGFGVNSRNQLTTSARSGTLTVAGTTGVPRTDATVNINGNAASVYPDGAFARAGFTVTNGVNSFTATGTDYLGRSSTNTVTVTLPSSVSFTYDANGNLTSDGQRGFTYDEENQLVGIQVTNSWKTGFAYDGFGRRREKTESTWNGSGWVTNLVVRYVYDGMLVLQERHFNPSVSMESPFEVVTYTRGLDLSGSLQGGGGIGGLLARTDSKGTSYYQTDGKGNVTALFNASGALVARYSYDPFGNTLAASGPMAEANVYRFSSKEIHPGTGLYYYGFRFYDPNLQRWLNRDPIQEEGGINLYGFVGNNPVSTVDAYGLFWPFPSSDISQAEWDRLSAIYGAKPYNMDDQVNSACRVGGLYTPGDWYQASDLTKEVGVSAITGVTIPEVKGVQILGTAQRLNQLRKLEDAGTALNVAQKAERASLLASQSKILAQIAKRKLPTGGATPFIPKLIKNKAGDYTMATAWPTCGPRAAQKGGKGLLDEQGRIWIWDDPHSGYPGHWDVQIDGGADYIRVGIDGNPVTKSQ